MQDIVVVFQAGWAAATATFKTFADNVKGGLKELGNLMETFDATKNGKGNRGWGEWASDVGQFAKDDILNAVDWADGFLGRDIFSGEKTSKSNTTFREKFGSQDGERDDQGRRMIWPNQQKLLANQTDVAPPAVDIFAAGALEFKNKLDELTAGMPKAGELTANLASKRADMLWQLAESGDTSGYGGKARVDLGKGTEDTAKGGGKKADKADSKAANRGSSDAASIMTRGASSSPMQQQVELTRTQNNILNKIERGIEKMVNSPDSDRWNLISNF